MGTGKVSIHVGCEYGYICLYMVVSICIPSYPYYLSLIFVFVLFFLWSILFVVDLVLLLDQQQVIWVGEITKTISFHAFIPKSISAPFVLKPSYNMSAPWFPANARPRSRTPVYAVTLPAIRWIFIPSATTARPAPVSPAMQGSGWRLRWWFPPTTPSISSLIPIWPSESLFPLCYSA
jgi:hypothetical protein